MWICPNCNEEFLRIKQYHYCGDKTIAEYLSKKTPFSKGLFYGFCETMQGHIPVKFKATKTMVALVADKRFGYITKLGRNFLEFILVLDKPYEDNYCFLRIVSIENAKGFTHVCRIYSVDDLNKEVIGYFEKAYFLAKAD